MKLCQYKAVVEYDGTNYHGFQRQDDLPTVQSAIEEALNNLFKEHIEVTVSGRTDKGVHALHQVIHFWALPKYPAIQVMGALNFRLNNSGIAILAVEETDGNFHARFDAKERFYIYKIINRQAPLTLMHNRAWHIKHSINAELMHEGGQAFIGQHDFSSFRSSYCQAKSPIRSINSVNVTREDELVTIRIAARSFLHNQVRIMVSALVKVGQEQWTADDIRTALVSCNRTAAPFTAPAHGLYLAGIEY